MKENLMMKKDITNVTNINTKEDSKGVFGMVMENFSKKRLGKIKLQDSSKEYGIKISWIKRIKN